MPPQPRGILFLNPRAGSFTGTDESELRTRAYDSGYRVVEVTPSVDVREIVRSTLSAGLREFIVAGGDGSIHHVAQALVGTDGVLSILPIGTVNHAARDLGVPSDWRDAFAVALRGSVRQIDTGRVNGIHFLNSLMIGIYPTITEYRERFRSTHSKWRAYARAVSIAMRQLRHVTLVVEMDGRVETMRAELFIVSVNAYDLSTTGMVALKTTLEDGRLSVYSLSFKSSIEFIRAAAKFFRGKIAEVNGFRSVRTAKLRIDVPKGHLRVSIDGEVTDLKSPLQVAAVPASLLVRMGPAA